MALFAEKAHRLPTGIFRSLAVAFTNLFRPAITIRYPKVRATIPARARWAVEIAYTDPPAEGVQTPEGIHHCQACGICEGACPDHLIRLDYETDTDRNKFIHHWYYNRGSCMMCGLCVEACPHRAISMGHDYELAHVDPSLLVLDLLNEVKAYRKARPVHADQPISGSEEKADA